MILNEQKDIQLFQHEKNQWNEAINYLESGEQMRNFLTTCSSWLWVHSMRGGYSDRHMHTPSVYTDTRYISTPSVHTEHQLHIHRQALNVTCKIMIVIKRDKLIFLFLAAILPNQTTKPSVIFIFCVGEWKSGVQEDITFTHIHSLALYDFWDRSHHSWTTNTHIPEYNIHTFWWYTYLQG